MRISPKLARRLQNDITEAVGALDIGLLSENGQERSRRMLQAKIAIMRVSQAIATYTDRFLDSEADQYHES